MTSPILPVRAARRLADSIVSRLMAPNDPEGELRCSRGPSWLVLCINNVCNLHCKMCDVGLGETSTPFWANLIGQDPRNMTLELLGEILTQASGFWPRPWIGFAYTEPLIHPRIIEFCRAAREAGFHAGVTSNGTSLARHADALVELGLDELTISIDGPAEVHDRIRGGTETFRKIAAGLDALNRAKADRRSSSPRLNISFAVTDENGARILDFVKEVEPFRPHRISISHLNFITGEMADIHNRQAPSEFHVTRSNLGTMDPAAFDTATIFEELSRVKEFAAARGKAFPKLEIVPSFRTREELDSFYKEPLRFVGGRTCADPWTMMMVKTDGTIIPAHGRCFNFPVGNIRDGSLKAIWNGERFTGFRRTLQRAGGSFPACARCCGVIGKA